MKILGIGNAIVDGICKIEDSFLSNHGLTKGTMKLVEKDEFKNFLKNLKLKKLYLVALLQILLLVFPNFE